MFHKTLLTAALVAAFAMPAVAATTAKPAPKAKVYYAEQSVKTKYCYAVTFKPDGKTATVIGTDTYPTLAKALAAIKADTSCKAPPAKSVKVVKPVKKTVAAVKTVKPVTSMKAKTK